MKEAPLTEVGLSDPNGHFFRLSPKRLSTCPRDTAILQVASRVFAARSSLRRGARRRRRASWNDARRTASSRGGGLPSGKALAPIPRAFAQRRRDRSGRRSGAGAV